MVDDRRFVYQKSSELIDELPGKGLIAARGYETNQVVNQAKSRAM